MNTKMKGIVAAIAVVSMTAMGIIAHAADLSWTVNLPRFSGNAVLIDDEMDGASSYGTNRIDFMGGDYDCMDVWVKIDGNKVYGKTTQYVGEGDYTMNYGGTKNAGTRVIVYGENGSWTTVNVTASGYTWIG